jgi:cytochrome c556
VTPIVDGCGLVRTQMSVRGAAASATIGGDPESQSSRMHTRWSPVAATVLVLATGCTRPAAPPPAADLLRTATIKDIMDSMVDPSGDALFESVVQIADEKGVREQFPQTDEEWENVRNHALVLLEAPNLLTMEGRKVAAHGEKSKNPEVELQPEQIQKLIDEDRPSFVKRARRLQDAATAALTAVNARDKDALFHAIEKVDKACENCHLHYWYPNDKRAVQQAKEDGGVLD